MKCPIDGSELKIAERQGIEIDYCPQCRGVWLDRGELDKMIERAAAAEMRTPPPVATRPYPVEQYRPENDAAGYDKRKNDEAYRRSDDDDYGYDSDDKRYDPNDPRYKKKKKSFLGEVFDIFGD
ncbi:MAG: zf-TFIIB domain-containing protein [Chitinophagaceae bacterium]|nr:zf-TFIIB domain-containing protein [Anaerolineae bacterium]